VPNRHSIDIDKTRMWMEPIRLQAHANDPFIGGVRLQRMLQPGRR
jgi:hypothetical protein